MRPRVEATKRTTSSQHACGLTFVRLVVTVGLIAGVVVGAAPTSGAAARWSVVPSVSPPGPPNGELSAVSCSSASDCFAVGTGGTGTFMEHWNGASWSIVASPSPAGLADVELLGVSCTSSTNCFAVGDASVETSTTSTSKTLIERWDGTRWSIVASPTPAGVTDVTLSGVSCSNATDCFAVGSSSSSPVDATVFTASPLVEHWDGTDWSMIAVPSPNDAIEAELLGVSCPSATTCFAAGDYESPASGGALLEQWDGTSWSIVEGSDSTQAVSAHAHLRVRRSVGFDAGHPVGSDTDHDADATIGIGPIFGFETTPGLEAVSCSSATSCFAVGVSFVGALAERWDGTHWTIVDTPTPHDSVGADLAGVSCANSTDCSAVGASQVATVSGDVTEISSVPLAEHWNGTSWTVEAEPSGAAVNTLTDVSCPTSTSCAAVGDTASIQQWNGTSWSIAPMSNKSSESQLVSVSCPSADICFAVGGSSSSNTQSNGLVERWNGTRWSVVPSPNLTGSFYAELSGVLVRVPRTAWRSDRCFLRPEPMGWSNAGTVHDGRSSHHRTRPVRSSSSSAECRARPQRRVSRSAATRTRQRNKRWSNAGTVLVGRSRRARSRPECRTHN